MIKVKDLKFKYWSSDRYALDGVNIHFPKGKYTAILGHNGSGKSTLSKILVGILKITSGQVLVNGIEINKHNLDEIRKYIGIIFQNPDNQFVGATVEDDIAFGLENKRMNRVKMRQMILELSEKVGMKEYLDREPLNLSGGQKQRVAIASILALDPEIIIFDEVTSMLDPKGKKEVLKIIRDIQQDKNKTLISITHDMDEAVLADNVVVLAKGKVIAQGTPKEIFKMPEVVKEAKLDLPFIYKLSLQIPGVEPTYDKKELLEKICK